MQVREKQEALFRKGSKTYFNASRFFSPRERELVGRLYGFVRHADNLVDSIPQDKAGFLDFRADFLEARKGSATGNDLVDDFAALEKELEFDPAWADAFLDSMATDLETVACQDIAGTLRYAHGSAEVIGAFMVRILGLPDEALEAAMLQGRAMQMINFIRDIDEDNGLGRRYLPVGETWLPDLREETARNNPGEFSRYLGLQLDRYREWQTRAYEGYHWLSGPAGRAIHTASAMYDWTAARIRKDPLVVFRKKVKPTRLRILLFALGAPFMRRIIHA